MFFFSLFFSCLGWKVDYQALLRQFEHLNHMNPDTFEVDDLDRLIKSVKTINTINKKHFLQNLSVMQLYILKNLEHFILENIFLSKIIRHVHIQPFHPLINYQYCFLEYQLIDYLSNMIPTGIRDTLITHFVV